MSNIAVVHVLHFDNIRGRYPCHFCSVPVAIIVEHCAAGLRREERRGERGKGRREREGERGKEREREGRRGREREGEREEKRKVRRREEGEEKGEPHLNMCLKSPRRNYLHPMCTQV